MHVDREIRSRGRRFPVSCETRIRGRTRAHAGREKSPPEKATTFHHRPTFALFHSPPTGSLTPLIEKLAELIKTPHPGRPAHIIILIQSLSVLRFPSPPFSFLSPHFSSLILSRPREADSRRSIAARSFSRHPRATSHSDRNP